MPAAERPRRWPHPVQTSIAGPTDELLAGIAQRDNHLVDDGVGFLTHLRIVGVLNRTLDEDPSGIGHPQRVCLRLGRDGELGRCDRDGRRTLNLEPYRVMQTARGTGASVRETLDNKIIVFENLRPQCIGSRLRESRFHVAVNLYSGQSLFKGFLQAVKQHIASRL